MSVPDSRRRQYPSERVVFFSDAVVAIAMTLLALELPVPEADTVDGVFGELGDHLSEYGAFLCSFFVIGTAWAAHHHLFDFVERIDGGVLGQNLQWLFLIVVTPFATRVMTGGEEDSTALRLAFYGFVQALLWVQMLRMYLYLRRRDLLSDPGDPTMRGWVDRRYLLIAVFTASIPLAFVNPWAGAGCWISIPLFMRAYNMGWVQRRRAVSA